MLALGTYLNYFTDAIFPILTAKKCKYTRSKKGNFMLE